MIFRESGQFLLNLSHINVTLGLLCLLFLAISVKLRVQVCVVQTKRFDSLLLHIILSQEFVGAIIQISHSLAI